MKINPSPVNIKTATAMMQLLNHEIINAAFFFVLFVLDHFFLVKINVSNLFVTLHN